MKALLLEAHGSRRGASNIEIMRFPSLGLLDQVTGLIITATE